MNPSSQLFRGKKIQVVAHHLELDGPVLYHFDRDLNPDEYYMPPLTNATWDFELKPASETSFSMLLHPLEMARLAKESTSMAFTLGVDMKLTIADEGGQGDRVLSFRINDVTGGMCLHVRPQPENCGGLPPMLPVNSHANFQLTVDTPIDGRVMVV